MKLMSLNSVMAELQYSFGFACGSFQYGRVVTYFNFASNTVLSRRVDVAQRLSTV
ncbi:MAG: hypothetical protein ACREDF_01030 [Thermoplasmata archaeon]